jgi:hypothetical protein
MRLLDVRTMAPSGESRLRGQRTSPVAMGRTKSGSWSAAAGTLIERRDLEFKTQTYVESES